MKIHIRSLWLVLLTLAIASCREKKPSDNKMHSEVSKTIQIQSNDVLISEPLSKEQQAKLNPEDVLLRLKTGNADFVKDNLTVRNTTERVRKASLGQYPKAVILSCMDSRVPVEDIFHSGIGNLFVIRVAGNVVNNDILASMEYACKISGAKLVLVLGHEYCGAVKAAIDGVEMGNITGLLKRIEPAVLSTSAKYQWEKKSTNPFYVEAVCEKNIRLSVSQITKLSPILASMEKEKSIIIRGGVYDMKTGKVEILNP